MTDVFTEFGPALVFIVTATGFGGFLWKTLMGIKKSSNEKEKARQDDVVKKAKEDAEKAEAIKRAVEDRAEEISNTAMKTAEDVKREVEIRAVRIKEEIADTARLLKEHSDRNNEDLRQMIREIVKEVQSVKNQQDQIKNDLTKRADMTNGNVANILNDMADLSEDVEDIFGLIEDTDQTNRNGGKRNMQQEVRRRQRTQNVARRAKRRKIGRDEAEQGRVKDRY